MEIKKFDVKISGEARHMLIDYVFFLANVNPAAAEKLRTDMIAEIQSLENFPERFPYLEPDNRKNPYRKMFGSSALMVGSHFLSPEHLRRGCGLQRHLFHDPLDNEPLMACFRAGTGRPRPQSGHGPPSQPA